MTTWTAQQRQQWIDERSGSLYLALAEYFGGEQWTAARWAALRLVYPMLLLWRIETGDGRYEQEFNAFNARAYANWHGETYMRAGRPWRAYPSALAAARDFVSLMFHNPARATASWQLLRDGDGIAWDEALQRNEFVDANGLRLYRQMYAPHMRRMGQ